MKHCRLVLAALLFSALTACTGIPEGVEPVRDFDVERYLGTWYEVARLDHRFERGLTDVTATYTLRDDGGVDVVNRGYRAAKGEWDSAEGKAYFIGDDRVGRLKVSFFGPFYGAYNVFELDRDGYRYAMVAGPNRSYLWILAREPDLAPEILERLVARAGSLGFDTAELIYVEHGNPPPGT